MKKFRLIQLAIAVLLFATVSFAQESKREVIYVESARFATPLLEKWASEYEKEYPEVEIIFTKGRSSDEKADLSLVSSADDVTGGKSGQTVLLAGRYALLPVANAENPLLENSGRKGLNKDRLENLFFDKGVLDGLGDPSSEEQTREITVYSGHKPESFAGAVAAHFGYSTADFRGRKILGDDVFLIQAILKDQTGITFNSLNYVFDTETRKLKEGLALLPLDLKKNEREILAEGNLDQIIALIEEQNIPLFPVENIGFVYKDNNRAAKEFLRWILSEGQSYNHEYGFLQTEETVLTAQLKGI